MKPIGTVEEVFKAIQEAKAKASGYCTNFFPVQAKLQGWIERGELFGESREGAIFFFKQDRDFWHLYFGAADLGTLRRTVEGVPALKAGKVTVDLVGNEAGLAELLGVFEGSGFRRYTKLYRLARMSPKDAGEPGATDARVAFAEKADCEGLVDLLGRSFDRYAEQLPEPHELEQAAENRQILLVRQDGKPAALLYFETQGLTSYVRYWLVDEPFRAAGYGSVLMRHYFRSQTGARRFILWVLANNENAIQKYRHYGYAPDGLVDHVLANEMIPHEIHC